MNVNDKIYAKVRLRHCTSCEGKTFHFHNINCGVQFSRIMFFSNGSFVTDDVFAEEVLAVASIPSQLLIGVHPKYGVTWRYAIQLK